MREAIEGYLFISPWIVGFLILTAGPMLAAFVLSLMDYDIVGTPQWVGLDNFANILTNDEIFPIALRVTIIYVIVSVPVGILLSLGIALLLNQTIAGLRFLRTIYYLPSLVSGVTVSILWLWIFQPDFYALIKPYIASIQGGYPRPYGPESFELHNDVLNPLWQNTMAKQMDVAQSYKDAVPKTEALLKKWYK